MGFVAFWVYCCGSTEDLKMKEKSGKDWLGFDNVRCIGKEGSTSVMLGSEI